jgi:hypothetical protein
LQELAFLFQFPITILRQFLRTQQSFFHGIKVGKSQFSLDYLDIPDRVDAAVYMDYIFIFKTPNYVDNGVNRPDMSEKLVAKPFASARPLDETGDIEDFDGGRQNPLRPYELGQLMHARVRNLDDAEVRINGTEWIIGRFGPGRCQRIENSRLPHIGKPDDTAVETHVKPSLKKKIPACLLAGAVKSVTQYQKFSVSTIILEELKHIVCFGAIPLLS